MDEHDDGQAMGLVLGTALVLFAAGAFVWTTGTAPPPPAGPVEATPVEPDPLAELARAGGSLLVYVEGGESVATVHCGGMSFTGRAADPLGAAKVALDAWRTSIENEEASTR